MILETHFAALPTEIGTLYPQLRREHYEWMENLNIFRASLQAMSS